MQANPMPNQNCEGYGGVAEVVSGPKAPRSRRSRFIGTFADRHLSGGEATRRRQLRVCLPPANSRDRKRERTDAMQDNETAGGLASLAARTTLESKRTVQR